MKDNPRKQQEYTDNLGAYLARKRRELELIAAPFRIPLRTDICTVKDAIESKFRIGAALKAAGICAAWNRTETCWLPSTAYHAGAYRVAYRYQRAGLTISGPRLYPIPRGCRMHYGHHLYTSSGMSALAALFTALGRSAGGARVTLPRDCYPETRQLATNYGPVVGITAGEDPDGGGTGKEKAAKAVVLADSGVPSLFAPSRQLLARTHLVIFDTTCFAAGSRRAGALLSRLAQAHVPAILVRSHTKLDSLGIEYGRLGSLTAIAPSLMAPERRVLFERLTAELPDAIRLLGAAAVPHHLPPFAGGAEWEELTRLHTASIIRNNHRVARFVARTHPGCRVTLYQHGLFFVLPPPAPWSQDEAERAAAALVAGLQGHGLPVCHAGSFGFDFVAVDAFAPHGGTCAIRVAMGDLPCALVRATAEKIAQNWHQLLLDDGRGRAAVRGEQAGRHDPRSRSMQSRSMRSRSMMYRM